ncbi:MAG: FliG C-terminal domain-containing protein [Elusimicrobiota bacterium]
MSRLHAALPLTLCFLWLLPAPGRAASAPHTSSELEALIAYENSLEDRLQAALRKEFHTDDVFVVVKVDLQKKTEKQAEEIMPGVPIPASANAPPVTRWVVSEMWAKVFIRQGITEDEKKIIEDTAKHVVGLGPQSVHVVVKDTIRQPTVEPDSPYAAFWNPAWLLSLSWLLIICVALGLIFIRFLAPLLGVIRDMTAARAGAGQREAAKTDAQAAERLAALEETPELQRAAAETDGGAGENLPFSFVRERHVPMIKFLLRRAQPRTAAVVVHYLPPRLAAGVLSELDPGARQEVVGHMRKVVQLDEANVRAIERALRSRIDYLMGGEDKLAEILDESPTSLQEELLEAVGTKDPALGRRLGLRIVRLEDLALLGPADFKLLTQRVPLPSLAAVLKHSKELADRILPKLTGGFGERLSEEIELTGELPPPRLAAQQSRVLRALSRLVREGHVVLKKETLGYTETEAEAEPAGVESLPPPVAAGDAGEGPAPEPLAAPEAGGEATADAPELVDEKALPAPPKKPPEEHGGGPVEKRAARGEGGVSEDTPA